MSAKLYGLAVSHPSHAARAMLEHKGIEYELVNFPPLTQPLALRAVGFRGRKVPALTIDGRRVQGTLSISRALEDVKPDPPLFPADRHDAVEEAEAWGERELQPLPRRIFRWALAARPDMRRWVVENVAKLPAPGVTSALMVPQARYFQYVSKASDENTRAGVERLPAVLDHVDALIADGTIGRPGEPNAADFQIASTIAVLRVFADIKPAIEGRPSAELAQRLFPRDVAELPPFLPEEWLMPLRAAGSGSAG
jgi:glutathione S-transferase